MQSHIHISALETLIFMANLIIAMFLLRLVTIKYGETKFGQALAVIIQ